MTMLDNQTTLANLKAGRAFSVWDGVFFRVYKTNTSSSVMIESLVICPPRNILLPEDYKASSFCLGKITFIKSDIKVLKLDVDFWSLDTCFYRLWERNEHD